MYLLDLQNALRQIDELKAINRELEAKLLLAGTGKEDAMPTKENYKVYGGWRLNSAQRWYRTYRYDGGVLPGD